MTENIEALIDKTIATLQSAKSLSFVKTWYKVNGFIPSDKPTISAGVENEQYEEYSQSMDKCTATLNIFATLDNRVLAGNERRKNEQRLEYGERAIRQMAHIIRTILIQNHTLDGAADSSFPPKIEYVTADGHEDLHVAVISFEVDLFVDRQKEEDLPTIATIDMKMELEVEGS